jgi:hypothetical protein
MTKSEILRLKKKIDITLEKITQEALSNGIKITSPKFSLLLEKIKENILKENGLTLEEYESAIDDTKKEKNIDFSALDRLQGRLEGLRGERGESIKGDKGENGKDGYTPVKGKDYFDGKDGKNGKDGKDGKNADTSGIVEKATEQALEAIKPLIPDVKDIENELPQLGTKIRDGLELLTGDERLDKKAIKGLEEIERLARQPKTINGGGGSTARNFYQLYDVPQTYKGQTGKVVKVKTTEDGLEFATESSGSGDLTLTYASAVFVPYSNANNNVNLGAYTLTASGLLGTLTGNVIGSASGLYGSPTLPDGTTATTQTLNDNSTKVATTAYADAAAGAGGASLSLNNIANVGASASINPGGDITNSLGTATLRWKDVYAQNLIGIANDSWKLNGIVATSYIKTGDVASDSWKLNGVVATSYLTNSSVAGDSWKLAGLASTSYALTGQEMYIGTTATNINRTSAGQTLAGITLTTPNIGTPSAGIITNLLGTATSLGLITPTLTNPVLVTPNLGTPTNLIITNATGTATININGVATNAILANSASTAVIANTAVDTLSFTGIANDSWKLAGLSATSYLASNGKATDSWLLNGNASTAFLTSSNGIALDSWKLGGLSATTYLYTSGKAADAWLFNGLAASGYALTGQQMYIGTTATNINRTSAAQTLAGITLTTPDIGTPSAGVVTNLTGTASININGVATSAISANLASNLSGTPALPNGVTATTQTPNDNSTKLATTAYADAAAGAGGASLSLNNIAGVAASASINPGVDIVNSLGTATLRWKDVFAQNIGATGTRVTKGWFTDLESTNAIVANITGTAVMANTAVNASIATLANSASTAVIADSAVSAINAGTVTGLAVTAGQTLTVTTGGTIGTAAYTPSTNYLASNGKATDSWLLNGNASTAFLTAGGVALDSWKLGGVVATSYLQGSNGIALDSWKLGGLVSTSYLASNGKATDSWLLNGSASTAFLTSTSGKALDSWKLNGVADTGYALTGQQFYIGTTQVAINRATDPLTLAGITLTTPDIGTPSAGVITNLSGTATSLGLITPTITNGVLVTPNLGTPSAMVLTNVSGTATSIGVSSPTITNPNIYSPIINLTIPTSDHSSIGYITDAMSAGTTVAIMQLVYLKSDGEWWLSDADSTTTCNGMFGMSLESKNDGQKMKVALPNSFVRDNSWAWTVGNTLYAGETPGALQATIPTGADAVIKVVGFASSSTVIYFNPSPDQQTTVA